MPESEKASPRVGLLLCDDLIFSSRITGTAKTLGLTILPARSVEALLALARENHPSGVIVELANPGLNLTELMQQLRELCTPMPRVVAYGSHVNTAALQAARHAGCDPVLPRSKFVKELPQALAAWLGAA